MLEIIDICKKINDNEILNKINIKINNGEVVGLIGENGSGKTMLIKIIMGLIIPNE